MHTKGKVLLITLALLGLFIASRTFTQGRRSPSGLVPDRPARLQAAGAAGVAAAPVEVRRNPKDGLNYVRIPAGTFAMGCSPGDTECMPDEKPSHTVTITKGFWLGETPVTVRAYKQFIAATKRQIHPAPPFNKGWANENQPIVSVTWDEADDYCTWEGGRLPTEAEWEYAARGGSTQARYGSLADIAGVAPYGSLPRVVGQKRPNGFGLYDMLGNVSQWVNDWYDEKYYQHSPSTDPPGPPGDGSRILRGGPLTSKPWIVRASYRDRKDPGGRDFYDSFRCIWNGPAR